MSGYVLLHEHLDGGLRPATVIELASAAGITLPASDEAPLREWFHQGDSGSLESYLAAFRYTLAVMQTEGALRRVAFEAIEDLWAQGVVYSEIRFAPLLNTAQGLAPEAVVESVLDGLTSAAAITGMRWGLILTAMRDEENSTRVAGLCDRYSTAGVVGFDLAGPEAGFPPSLHIDAIESARASRVGITLHAGEAAGVESIRIAVETCGTDRIGHGVELIEDCIVEDGEITGLGPVARAVLDAEIPLEVCPTSNVHTKGWHPAQHPVGALYRAGFAVTINTDNRLMSSTSLPEEFELLRRHHGFGASDVETVTRTALAAAFCPDEDKRKIWETLIAPRLEVADLSW